ncbi:type III secretion system translocon subunit SctE [Photorhabdus aegyptia]|uniref:Type III secretion system translocon protein, YopB/IpaB/SipB family n=1 Tax=Photorhabdus aegyptia TaxID=2805098 RepID=A0A022PMQ3_9GAMM|nr:type III secretion system translocon subunit SctE [Photorhabdus aegyptia]EYU17362.1 type III secretion system translocon protein, YopB/IpaB/SipB family [Photorhabdus aegyptia]
MDQRVNNSQASSLGGIFQVDGIPTATSSRVEERVTLIQAGNVPFNGDKSRGGVSLPAPLAVVNTHPDQEQMARLKSVIQEAKQATGLIKELTAKLTETTSRLSSLVFASSEAIEIELGKLTSELDRNQTNLKIQDIQRARQQSLQKMDENQQKIKEAENSAKEAQKSGLFSKIFGWISAIASIVVGAIMVATGVGAVAGALLIAGGVMGVVSQSLQQAAQDGLISKETMKWLGPVMMAIEITMAVAAAAVSFGGSAVGMIAKMGAKMGKAVADVASKVGSKVVEVGAKVAAEVASKVAAKAAEFSAKVAGTAANTAARSLKVGVQASDLVVDVANGAAQTTNAAFQSKAANRQADVLLSRSELTAFQAVMDRLKEELSQMVESFQHVMEMIFQMLNARGDMINNLASRPQEI